MPFDQNGQMGQQGQQGMPFGQNNQMGPQGQQGMPFGQNGQMGPQGQQQGMPFGQNGQMNPPMMPQNWETIDAIAKPVLSPSSQCWAAGDSTFLSLHRSEAKQAEKKIDFFVKQQYNLTSVVSLKT